MFYHLLSLTFGSNHSILNILSIFHLVNSKPLPQILPSQDIISPAFALYSVLLFLLLTYRKYAFILPNLLDYELLCIFTHLCIQGLLDGQINMCLINFLHIILHLLNKLICDLNQKWFCAFYASYVRSA